MIAEIIELLKNYTKQFIDKEYYIKLSEIFTRHNNISPHQFNGLTFLTKEEAQIKFNVSELTLLLTKTGYNEADNKIYIFLESIGNDTRARSKLHLSEQEHYILSNLLRSVDVLVSLEYVVQIIGGGRGGLEGIITKDCPANISDSAYAISPARHFAHLRAYLIVWQVAKEMKLSQQVLDYLAISISKELYYPYLYNKSDRDFNDPLYHFYSKINKPFPFDIDSITNLSFENRILFELFISNQAYKDFYDLIDVCGVTPDAILKKLDIYSQMDPSIFVKRSPETAHRHNK